MTTRLRVSRGRTGSGPSHGRRLFRRLPECLLGPAGVLIAIAIAGCSLGSTSVSPTAAPTTTAIPSLGHTPVSVPTLASGFSQTGPMAAARESHTATLLSDGRVLIAGGLIGVQPNATAELYDPATGAFSQTGSMTRARASQTATLLHDGRVLFTGGRHGAYFATAEL